MPSEQSKIRELEARHQIRDALNRYCRGIDRVDMGLVRSAFHADAIERHPDYHGDIEGFIASTEPLLQEVWATQHQLFNVLIEFEGDCAYVESYCLAEHIGYKTPPAECPYPPGYYHIGSHRYIDIFECRDGNWKINDRTLVVCWQRTMEGVDWIPMRDYWNVQQRDKTDLSYIRERSPDMFAKPPSSDNYQRGDS